LRDIVVIFLIIVGGEIIESKRGASAIFRRAAAAIVNILILRPPFPLPRRLRRERAQVLDAARTARHTRSLQIITDSVAGHLVSARDAGRSSEGPMTLNEFLRPQTRRSLKIIDILREIREQLPLLLQQRDESVRGRKAVTLR
jgi:hypothetical protein